VVGRESSVRRGSLASRRVSVNYGMRIIRRPVEHALFGPRTLSCRPLQVLEAPAASLQIWVLQGVPQCQKHLQPFCEKAHSMFTVAVLRERALDRTDMITQPRFFITAPAVPPPPAGSRLPCLYNKTPVSASGGHPLQRPWPLLLQAASPLSSLPSTTGAG